MAREGETITHLIHCSPDSRETTLRDLGLFTFGLMNFNPEPQPQLNPDTPYMQRSYPSRRMLATMLPGAAGQFRPDYHVL